MKEKVLVVDDQYGIRALLGEVLQKEGYAVLQATTGHEAIEIIKNTADLQLILLDLKIPGIDGMEVLQQLKMTKNTVPVILMTAYSEEETLQKAYELGLHSHLMKPFDINELTETVKQLFETA